MERERPDFDPLPDGGSATGMDEFTIAAVVSDLSRASEATAADAIEFRMDHASEPLAQLEAYDGGRPVIATNRSVEEGGEARGPDRLETLATAAERAAVRWVDVELATVEAGEAAGVMDACEETDTDLIVSWHDFDGTPPEVQLERRLRAAATHGSVGKAAVTATHVADVLPLLAVTHRLTADGLSVATMSMGASGRHSRVVAPLYGSKIGYAPVDSGEATAPGQLDLDTMATVLDALR